ncbi:cell division protein PerM [Cellulomonas rhizosphaerae]|uniref:Uncharacterized protein n=1 Tax=Cellulomonas rhizosphaerae TaxID=2293719 RepID=A0A413RR24_9CELL|nr:DUF6350 family protein [Cellulomonas rhizosphaerae]RHA44394.1 hypothetical protein D1825_01485 [Cellulomonas rhizosphaerae]
MSQSRPSSGSAVADRGRAAGPGRGSRRRRTDTGSVPITATSRSARATEALSGSALEGAPRWVSGVLAALQAAVLSLLALVLPAIAAFVATAADPSNSGVSWFRAVRVGGSLWLAGHGVPLGVGGVGVTIVPLGVTALAVFTCYASARRSGVPTLTAYLAGIGGYVAMVLGVALVIGTSASGLLRGLAGAVLVAGIGMGTGLAARTDAPTVRSVTRPLWSRVPRVVRVGATAGTIVAGSLVAVAAAVTALWVVAGLATIGDVVDGLGLDPIGGAVLAFGELAFAPNLVVWAIAWLAGPGFAVGAGTHFAPHEVLAGPMPAVPMLGALPSNTLPGIWSFATPALLIALGALGGWYVHRRISGPRWWHPAVACVALAGFATLVVTLLVVVASGGIGPGRMAHVGASGLIVGLAVAWPVLVGALVVALPGDPVFRAAVRGATSRRGEA